jgi:hypothetical protein
MIRISFDFNNMGAEAMEAGKRIHHYHKTGRKLFSCKVRFMSPKSVLYIDECQCSEVSEE